MEALTYLLFTVIAAHIDAIRIKNSKKANINHTYSVLIGFAFFLIVVVLFNIIGTLLNVKWIIFAFICIGIRGVFYDPALNLFRGLSIDYTSKTTTSLTDKFLTDFWTERIVYGVGLLLFIILYYI